MLNRTVPQYRATGSSINQPTDILATLWAQTKAGVIPSRDGYPCKSLRVLLLKDSDNYDSLYCLKSPLEAT
ncbi:MAG: hypothetical protein D5R98_05660 [Desulfonatronovibrio sp. MSAO_Bac4]|nr:MAG: hypothetical protein D5R98_05660 [Desulfonatronovibrio sp. MSAO_Bac4]